MKCQYDHEIPRAAGAKYCSKCGEDLSTSPCSDYPLPWSFDSVRSTSASVYAADSTPVCYMNGAGSVERAELIVKFANQNVKDHAPTTNKI